MLSTIPYQLNFKELPAPYHKSFKLAGDTRKSFSQFKKLPPAGRTNPRLKDRNMTA